MEKDVECLKEYIKNSGEQRPGRALKEELPMILVRDVLGCMMKRKIAPSQTDDVVEMYICVYVER